MKWGEVLYLPIYERHLGLFKLSSIFEHFMMLKIVQIRLKLLNTIYKRPIYPYCLLVQGSAVSVTSGKKSDVHPGWCYVFWFQREAR